MAEQNNTPDMSPDDQAREQTGQSQVRLRIDTRDMTSSYANAFRTNASADEVLLDFGLNQIIQMPSTDQQHSGNDPQATGEILFQVDHRVIMNYTTLKRLAISLGQLVRQHEDRFGELQLNVADRMKNSEGS